MSRKDSAMPAFFATAAVGLLIAIIGVINMTGNINTLQPPKEP